jgi:hypothetical protein
MIRGLLTLAWAACATPVDTVVLHHGGQQRGTPVSTCRGCLAIDVATADPSEVPPAARVVIDGHSLPGHHLLDLRQEDLLAFVTAAAPTWVVLATCHGAETSVLSALFAIPSVQAVWAHPDAQPWDGFELEASDCPTGPPCAALPSEFHRYLRDDVRDIEEASQQLIDGLSTCQTHRQLLRLTPVQVCGETPDGLPFLTATTTSALEPACFDGPPVRYLQSTCDPRLRSKP